MQLTCKLYVPVSPLTIFLCLSSHDTNHLACMAAVSNLYIQTQARQSISAGPADRTALRAAALPENPQPYSQTANVTPGIHTRLLQREARCRRLTARDRVCPNASWEGYASIPTSELLQRPEIESALQGFPLPHCDAVLEISTRAVRRPRRSTQKMVTSTELCILPLRYRTPDYQLNFIYQIFGAVIIAGVIATIAGRILARQIAQPLEGLTSAAKPLPLVTSTRAFQIKARDCRLTSLSKTFDMMAGKPA